MENCFIYQPTPLEDAYSHYLIRTAFPPSDASAFRISGRHAVPFLSQSGLPRDLLRQLWSFVDPETTGYLSDRRQFTTLLRLVALAQFGSIDASSHLPSALMESMVTDLPLATFQGYPIPEASSLLSSYSTMVPQPPIISAFTTSAVVDPFGNLEAASIAANSMTQPPLPMHQLYPPQSSSGPVTADAAVQLEDDDEFGDFTTTPSAVTVGAWDALDQLVTVVDAPLPSSSQTTDPEHMALDGVEPTLEATKDFGSFADAAPNTMALSTLQEISFDGGKNELTISIEPASSHTIPNDLGLASTFDVFSTANASQSEKNDLFTTTASNPNATVIENTFTSLEDPFSAFDAIATVADSALSEPHEALNPSSGIVPVTEEETDDFGDFVVSNEAFPAIPGETTELTMMGQPDDFGDFLGGGPSTTVSTTETRPTDLLDSATEGFLESVNVPFPSPPVVESNWDALDALVETKDTPLPALQPLQFSVGEDAAKINVLQNLEESESEGFGDFVGTNDVKEKAFEFTEPSPNLVTDVSSDDFLLPTPDLNGWGALDALAGYHDTPLTSLDTMNVTSSLDNSIQNPIAGESIISSNDVQEQNDAPFSVSESLLNDFNFGLNQQSPDVGWEALDALNVISDKPLVISMDNRGTSAPSMLNDVANPTNEDFSDGFGDFVSGPGIKPPDLQTPESDWEALDALKVISDKPLTMSMDTRATSAPCVLNDFANASNEDFSDGFGDFFSGASSDAVVKCSDPSNVTSDDAPISSKRIEDTSQVLNSQESGWDALDALHVSLDAPLPSVLNASEVITGHESDASAPVHSANTVDVRENEDLSDGFGDFVSGPRNEFMVEPSIPVASDVIEDSSAAAGEGYTVNCVMRDILSVSEPKSSLFDRTDSSYYSANAKSVSSDSQDFNFFEDAIMNVVDDENDATHVKPTEMQDVFSVVTGDDVSRPFTTFDSVALTNPSLVDVQSGTDMSNVVVQGDDFGDFKDFSVVPNGDVESMDKDDDFGDFEAVSYPAPSPSDIVVETEVPIDEFGDFGDFAQAELSSVQQIDLVGQRELVVGWNVRTEEDWSWAKNQLVSKFDQLPDILRLQSTGVPLDFGLCFDTNIGIAVPLSEDHMRRLIRCAKLMDLLSSSHALISSTYWNHICCMVETELSNGLLLLQDATKLSSKDRDCVKAALHAFVLGMGEMLLVVRCIIATLADLLLLPPSTTLSKENLESLWCSNALVMQAIHIEELWDRIQDCATSLDLSPLSQVIGVVTIRTRSDVVTDLCHFSLQAFPDPFKNEKSTEVPVNYANHSYMACTANLLAHKSDFFSTTTIVK